MMIRKVIFTTLLVLFSLQAEAAEFKSGDFYALSKGDTLAGDIFYGGRSVSLRGVVQSDAILGAESSRVDGKIKDDLFAWSKSISLDGEVGDTFLGFAKDIEISGTVHGDVVAFAGNVQIMSGARIEGNLYVGTGSLSIQDAFIGGDIKGGAHKMFLNGQCAGNVELEGTTVHFGEKFKADKDVTLTLHKKPEGAIENAPSNMVLKIEPEKRFYQRGMFYYFLISAFVIGSLIIGFFPSFFNNILSLGKEKIGKNLLAGVSFLIITPIVATILLIIFPLGLLFWAAYLTILYLSYIFVAFILGPFLMKVIFNNQTVNKYLSFFVGLILISLFIKIPFVGGLLFLLTLILGGGTFVHYLFLMKKNDTPSVA